MIPLRRGFDLRRWISSLLLVASIIGVATFDVGSAAPATRSVNVGNQVAVAAVLPPTDAATAVRLNLLGLSCRAVITWTASASPGVTGYEIRRLSAGSGAVTGGPWTVSGSTTSYVDSPVPLRLLVDAHAWQVRALVDGWPSDWVTASVDNALLCLL